MFKLSIFFCCFVMAFGRVEMIQSDVQILKEHPMDPINVTSDELTFIISEEWMKMVASCFPNLDPMASISASFDYSLMGTNTLAWASSTMLLLNDVWQPALTNKYYTGNDFLIGVNPLPPNGWHVGPMADDCSGISYRYDLRTVLRHEMMHGIGVGSFFSIQFTRIYKQWQMLPYKVRHHDRRFVWKQGSRRMYCNWKFIRKKCLY